ncbi:MAG: class I SAM-dependent methyltransferase [Bacteroidia bacterium]
MRILIQAVKKLFSLTGFQISRINSSTDVDDYIRLYGKESIEKKNFYNIGAGNFYHPCWTNIDNGSDWEPEPDSLKAPLIDYDLFSLQPLPLADNGAQLIYTSHTIEHVTDTEVQYFFNEAYRVLKPGAILRIVTPNIDIEYRAWRDNDRDYWFWLEDYSNPAILKQKNLRFPLKEASNPQLFLTGFASTASIIKIEGSSNRIDDVELEKIFKERAYTDALDYCLSRCSIEVQKKFTFDHINWFNKEKLFRMLKQAGFEKMHLSAYGQSYSHVMRNLNYFDRTLPKVSLYAEAVK